MDKKCILCRSSVVDELQLGPIHSLSNIAVHQNCLVCYNYELQQQQKINKFLFGESSI